ncbi:YeeE/YedE family protein [Alteribacillus sp. HJP-4]|uniref:YeeE/YedE family protein n=1 Tax=Alteribacillus sp. HJP-4 TaxID=2775394 RepID=UPI0035CD29D7
MTSKQTQDTSSAKAPDLRDPQNILTIIVIVIGAALAYAAYDFSGWQFVLLFAIGIIIGFSLFHARFGFASVYRQIVETGNTEMLRAHMLMLATATTLFALILALHLGLFGNVPMGATSPISVGLIIGSFMFGFGMEIGSGLAPAAMYRAEGSRTASIFTILGFLIGATVGAVHFSFWNEELPSIPEVSLALDTPLGYSGAWGLQIAIFAAVGIGSYMYKKRKQPPPLPPLPSAPDWRKVIFGSWPLWVGAVLLAAGNAAVLVVQGEPWKLTAAFTLWGSKLADALGFQASEWGYWGEQEPLSDLTQSVFMNELSVLNFGVLIGTAITLTLGGLVRFGKIPPRIGVVALLGGTFMGYGACISFGANIGAYFSGIASFSLHAWIWAPLAIFGTYTAYFTEKKFQLTRSVSRETGKN